jgi:hypothetical protein
MGSGTMSSNLTPELELLPLFITAALLKIYGTADGHFRYLARPEQAYLPGLG